MKLKGWRCGQTARQWSRIPPTPGFGGQPWPQVMLGQFGSGGSLEGPFRSVPTDIVDSIKVEYPDVAVNARGGVVVYSDLIDPYSGLDGYHIGYQLLDVNGRPVGTAYAVFRPR